MEKALTWWRVRTAREQRLLQFVAILVFVIVLPVWAYVAAASYREAAATRLTSAQDIAQQVEVIAQASRDQAAAPQADDASARGRALAAAHAAGLTPARIEAVDPQRVRIAFEPADSLAIYRWIEAVGRSGAQVSRSAIVRVSDSDLVSAEFEVVGAP